MTAILNISIIGAGQIGSRHLQALAHLKESTRIQLVDPSKSSLEVACQRFHSTYKGDPKRIVLQTFSTIKDLDEYQDVAIVPTDAMIRSKVIKELIQIKNIKAMIFEKVLFQTEKEYFEIDSLLQAKNIPAWVNCMLRATDFFKNLKTLLDWDKTIHMRVEGIDWGLACNGIHFLDLFSFLTGCSDFEFTDVKFHQVIQDFKRPESKEFIGEMVGRNSKGHQLIMNCKEGDTVSKHLRGLKTIYIDNGTTEHYITVYPDQVTHRTLTGKSETEVTEPLPLQSQITHRFIEDVVRSGSCALPTYPDSMILHLCLIREFLSHLIKITGKNVTRCPIT
jgi:predicted dehydrogenase